MTVVFLLKVFSPYSFPCGRVCYELLGLDGADARCPGPDRVSGSLDCSLAKHQYTPLVLFEELGQKVWTLARLSPSDAPSRLPY